MNTITVNAYITESNTACESRAEFEALKANLVSRFENELKPDLERFQDGGVPFEGEAVSKVTLNIIEKSYQAPHMEKPAEAFMVFINASGEKQDEEIIDWLGRPVDNSPLDAHEVQEYQGAVERIIDDFEYKA